MAGHRLLALLAFASPQIVSEIAERIIPPAGVTDLAKTVGYLWVG